ncbi:sulfite exporter TauE/SafE family protein [Coralliovum pocilloporae]|uniref:sulfite exporter TauE/SafE family protein n=1 Tax=Coralliovum pocilloporae TaxID=3066369 RepID=UPI003307121D
MIEDPYFYAIALPAILLVGLSKGGFGGALAMLGVPMMTLVIPPVQAAAILLPILIVMDIVGLLSYRKIYDRQSLINLIPPALLGILAGWAMASLVSDAMVRLIVGLIAVSFTLRYWLQTAERRKTPARHSRPWGILWGTIAGFTSFVSHAGGPPYQMYTLPLRMDPRLFAGTAVIFFAVVNSVKLIPYFALGQFSADNLLTSLVLMPLAPIATLIGVWAVNVINPEKFYSLTYSLLFLIGLKLIWDAGTTGFL